MADDARVHLWCPSRGVLLAGLFATVAAASVVLPGLDNAVWATQAVRLAMVVLALVFALDLHDPSELVLAATRTGWGRTHRAQTGRLLAQHATLWIAALVVGQVLLSRVRPGTSVPWLALTVEWAAVLSLTAAAAATPAPPARRHRGLVAVALVGALGAGLWALPDAVALVVPYAPRTFEGLDDPLYRAWVDAHWRVLAVAGAAVTTWLWMTRQHRPSRRPPLRDARPTGDRPMMHTRMEPSAGIELSRVSRSYGSVVALDEITWSVDAGVRVLAGPNGAGKTTLLRLLATLDQPDAGDMVLLAQDPREARGRQQIREKLGYMPQELAVTPGMRAEQYLDHLARLKGHADRVARRNAVEKALEAVELRDVARRRIRALSGGMQRRLLFAQALLCDADLFVLDEPLVGMDPQVKAVMLRRIAELGHDGMAVVSTHQLSDVIPIATSVTVLLGGRILFDGTPEALAEVARGCVWVAPTPHPDPVAERRQTSGVYRHLSASSPDGTPEDPTPEDGYLWLLREHRGGTAAARGGDA